MISNTELYYQNAKRFQDERRELSESYEKRMKDLDRFKGSKGYETEVEKLNKRYDDVLTALQDKYRPEFNVIFRGMVEAIGRRTVKAPTTDQVNLLNVLKMKRKVTLEDCQRTAESVKDNPIAVSIVSEIAHDHGIMHSFNHLCPEMSSQKASDLVTSIKNQTEDFLQHDTTKASRVAYKYYQSIYGEPTVNLTKRPLFTDKESCYREVTGLDGDTLIQFSKVVD